MDFFDLIKERRSVRAFTQEPIGEEQLKAILRAANAAPSAGNYQAYEIYVVRAAQRRRALADAALGQSYVASAPVSLVFCENPGRVEPHYGERGRRLYAKQDATIACTFAMLAVTALGLATVWVGAFDDEAVWKAIGAPQGVTPVAILPIGHAAEKPDRTPRRPLTSLVHEV
mgnify:CR=1 FL=1